MASADWAEIESDYGKYLFQQAVTIVSANPLRRVGFLLQALTLVEYAFRPALQELQLHSPGRLFEKVCAELFQRRLPRFFESMGRGFHGAPESSA